MVHPISTTNSVASHKHSKLNTLGQSIDRQYDINPPSNQKAKRLSNDELNQAFDELIKEHLFDDSCDEPSIKLEEKEITVGAPSKEPSSSPIQNQTPKNAKTDLNWNPDIESLDTHNQHRVISERVTAIKHSAANALANLKFFLKDLSLSIIANKSNLTTLKQKMKLASKSGGANYELVQSYKQPLNIVNRYIQLSDDLNTSVNNLCSLLNQVEAGMDFIDADIFIGTDNFEQSLATCNVKSDFSQAFKKIDELISLLSKTGNPFQKAFSDAESLSKVHKNKIKAIKSYLKGPKNPELIKKPDSDYESEMTLLKNNLNLLNKYVPILKGCLKGKVFLESQLADVRLFVAELNEIHRLFVIGEYQALGKDVPELCFNGKKVNSIIS